MMVIGTASKTGKSLLTAALCRVLARRGWRVAPFKGQNIGLNAYMTTTGCEISFNQAVQAWAAGVIPLVEMNPILLKPRDSNMLQIIFKGKLEGITKISEYYQNYFQPSWQLIEESLQRLAQEFDLIVCEGAGSPAEINLKHLDLSNMRIARYLNAPTLLVVDMSRGGALAHIIGTLELLEPVERSLVKGIVLNKFRGERSLLDSDITWLENRTNIPVMGVIPQINSFLPTDDSLDLLERSASKPNHEITIAIIRLPRISNFTDFDPLEAESTVSVKYINPDESLGHPDAVIIPGSKTTISDLITLHKSGMAAELKAYAASGGTILGICGGFQMLGYSLSIPSGKGKEEQHYQGLNLLPLNTDLGDHKIARQRNVISNYPQVGFPVSGYEIHQGRSRLRESPNKNVNSNYKPMFDDSGLGLVNQSQSIWGCYLHGLFDNGPWRRAWLNHLRQQRGLSSLPTGIPNYREQREAVLNALANLVEENLDLTPVLPKS